MDQYLRMKENVRMLGRYLGEVIETVHGQESLDLIELIRKNSKLLQNDRTIPIEDSLLFLKEMSADQVVLVARAFSHFLNLVNISEQHQSTARTNLDYIHSERSFESTLKRLLNEKIPKQDIQEAIEHLFIELVLTAHPTEVTRRSLIHKHLEINSCLNALDHSDISESEKMRIKDRLKECIQQTWHTHEFRNEKPSPIDEAKWGFAVVENSLWDAVPRFLSNFEYTISNLLGERLDPNFSFLRMSSWIGADRDGNPYVTAKITQSVIYLARLRAAELFLKDIELLHMELSIVDASFDFEEKYGKHKEPYRYVLKRLRKQLISTIEHYTSLSAGEISKIPSNKILSRDKELWEVLYDCYNSLCAVNLKTVANSLLRDSLYRIKTFGVTLLRLDVRQDSSKHSAAMSELTEYYEMGNYATWSEQEKQDFLLQELSSNRPLIPTHWKPSEETQEILDTFDLIASEPSGVFNAYIISMAKLPSDVLLVKLFLKAYHISYNLHIVPLFETLEDLNQCPQVMKTLFDTDWYLKDIKNNVTIMIGYSDSAKDAGMLAASWAQYTAQEALINLCQEYDIALRLFHGRGGTIGRGGAPAHEALLSQPPMSLKQGLRVTEQGEMIRFKLGFPELAVETFDLYASAILEANLCPPPMPKKSWRQTMDLIAQESSRVYNGVVRENPDFIEYFKQATPAEALSMLPVSSRPTKRFASKGVEGLRAIPWIFAWTQNRLLLPTWLGVGESLQYAIDHGQEDVMEDMCQNWPFFNTRMSLLEMVFSKTDLRLSSQYEAILVDPELKPLGDLLRRQFRETVYSVISLNTDGKLMGDLPWIADSIAQRNIYTDPLNLLQIDLLDRLRTNQNPDEQKKLEEALMITISGIAAGMRNTG